VAGKTRKLREEQIKTGGKEESLKLRKKKKRKETVEGKDRSKAIPISKEKEAAQTAIVGNDAIRRGGTSPSFTEIGVAGDTRDRRSESLTGKGKGALKSNERKGRGVAFAARKIVRLRGCLHDRGGPRLCRKGSSEN